MDTRSGELPKPDADFPNVVFSTHMDTVPPFIPSSPKMPRAFMAAESPTPRASSPHRSPQPRPAPGTNLCRPAVCGGRRTRQLGAQTANNSCDALHPRSQPPLRKSLADFGERRAHRKPHRAVFERHTAREVTASGRMAHSAYPGARRFRHRQPLAAPSLACAPCLCLRPGDWPVHPEHRHDRRRTRPQRSRIMLTRICCIAWSSRPTNFVARSSPPPHDHESHVPPWSFRFSGCAPSAACPP